MSMFSSIRRLWSRPPRAELERRVIPDEAIERIRARYLLPPAPPSDIAPAGRLEIVTRQSWTDTAMSSAGWRLTPEKLFQIYLQAENGYPEAQCDAFESCYENDGHLQGLITTRKSDIIGRDLWIMPGDDRPASKTAAVTLAQRMSSTNLEELVEHLMEAPFVGYSYAETEWALDGTWAMPRWWVLPAHRRFQFDRNDVPLLDVDGTSERISVIADPWRWVRAEMYHRRTPRAGSYRCTSWWATFKRMSVRDWLAFAEKFGIPMILGKYEEDAGVESRRVLEEAVRRIGIDGNAVMSDSTRIDVLNQMTRSGDSTSLHPAIIASANAEMSKAINGATLTSDASGGPGSFALGKVHAGRAHSISVADAKRISRWFQRHVGQPFVDLNNLSNAAPPALHVALLPDNPLQDAQVTNTLWNIGVPLSLSQIRKKHGLRPPIDAADTLEKPPDAAPGAEAPSPSE